MLNPKLIAIAAACGFILSFIAGLLAGVSFGVLLVRALVSTVILGGITAGVSVVYSKFLEQVSDSVSSSENVPLPGSIVDITLGDDDLMDDDAGPGFFVDPSVQKRTGSTSQASGVKTEQSADVEQLSSLDEEDLSKANPDVQTSSERMSESAAQTAEKKTAEKSSLDDELDELPDIASLSRDILSSDDESMSVNANKHGESPSGHNAQQGTQDANLMAQAIRTILSKDG